MTQVAPHPEIATLPPVPLAAWSACSAITRTHGRTFYLASRFLPPARRQAIHAIYAYCRIADDIADRSPDLESAARGLDEWEAQIAHPTDPVALAFAAVRARYGIPVAPVHDLLAGVRMDLTPARYETWEDLRRYCYHVAGTVGLMTAPVLGCQQAAALPHAVDLGVAMQLTNVLRDVGEDARQGRLYLPLQDLDRFGCDPEAILSGRPNGQFSRLMAFEIDRARAIYAQARLGYPALSPSGRLTALAGERLYAAILNRIEENGFDVFSTRAHVSTGRKIGALPGIAATFMRLSWTSELDQRTA
jgi:phytoene synthase